MSGGMIAVLVAGITVGGGFVLTWGLLTMQKGMIRPPVNYDRGPR